MLLGTLPSLPRPPPNFSSSFTSAVLCYFFLPLHPPPLLLHFCFSRSVCLAHTGDNSGSKHSRVKTNSFCQNENKPLSPCSLSLSLSFFLSCSFFLHLFFLAVVKINCSVSIYFTKEDLTTAENPSSCFKLYLPNSPVRIMLAGATIC